MPWVEGDPLTPVNMNAKMASAPSTAGFSTNTLQDEVGGTITSLASVLMPQGLVLVDGFGAVGNGVTEDGNAIWAAENARQPGQSLWFTPTKTYAVGSLSTASLPQITKIGGWIGGGTLKYIGANQLKTGSDGGSLGMVNVRVSGANIALTLDGNNLVRYPVTVESSASTQVSGVDLNNIHQNLLQTNGQWTGVHYATSVDITGSAISARALNVSGRIRLPSCPIIDPNTLAIVDQTPTMAHLYGNNHPQGNGSGVAVAISDLLNISMVLSTISGIPQFVGNFQDNSLLGNVQAQDVNANAFEGYGVSAAINSQYSIPSGRTLSYLARNGVGSGWFYANAGFAGTGAPNVWIDARSAKSDGLIENWGQTGSQHWVSLKTGGASQTSSSLVTQGEFLFSILSNTTNGAELAIRSGNSVWKFASVSVG